MSGGVGVEHDGRGTGVMELGLEPPPRTASKAGTWSVILGAEMSCYSDKTHCSHSGLMPEGPPNTGPDNQARGVMTIHGSGQVPSIPDNE